MAWEVLIAGGGFGGLYAARALERALPPQSAKVTLISDVNFMLYTPLLPGAAGGSLEPRHVVVPLRNELSRTDLRLGHVTGADPDAHIVRLRSLEGDERELRYDRLIVALGSVSRSLPVPGLAEHGRGFKTLADAIALRNRLLETLEMAESGPTENIRAYLTYVFTGAGYAGLEGLAELQDFAADVIELYPRCRTEGMRWILVEARDRVMPEIPAALAEFATAELRTRGIEVHTSTTVENVTATSVRLSTGEDVPCRTFVWTAGVKAHPVVANLGLPLGRSGRIVCDKYLQVQGRSDVWAIGDAAAVPDPARPGEPCPPTAQHSLRQGRLVARNVAASFGGSRRPRPFTYKTLGVFVDMGRNKAVADTAGITWSGLPAWFLARTYHVLLMPGISRKVRLLVDWTVGLLFGHDASELGQLGHPGRLDDEVTSGGSGRDGTTADRPPVGVPHG